VEEPVTLVLAGDIGGTKTRLALYEAREEQLRAAADHEYPSADYGSLVDIARDFIGAAGAHPERACFGIAGPVRGRVARTTNLPWTIDADALEREAGIPRVLLFNDLEATAWGIGELAPDALLTLQEGREAARGNRAVIAAGTGLGEAGMTWDGTRYRPFATEGGHTGFSPGSDLEDALLRYLRRRHGHVSWERVLSGPGLVNIFDLLLEDHGVEQPAALARAMKAGDPAAEIVRSARQQGCEVCTHAVELFVRLYGSEAGDLALKIMSTGGLYVGGGIAPKILPELRSAGFLAAFADKGRMRSLLEAMPVRVILDDRAALLGAGRGAFLYGETS
jgi:glucokinase